MTDQELGPISDDEAALPLVFQNLDKVNEIIMPDAGIHEEEIDALNVVSGAQYIGTQNIVLTEQGWQGTQEVKKPPPFILPQLDIQHFTGREAELEQLESLLLNPSGPRMAGIAGLTGTAGMGKSALAIHFAKTHRDQFPDGVIGLRVDGGQVDTLAQRFASHVGVVIDPQQQLSAAEIMQSVFQRKQALLIFDNAEDSTVQVLHPGGDKCAVIVTTRNRGLLRSFGIQASAQVDLQRFSFEETKQLLSQIFGERRVTSESDAVQAIHDLVGGLPLAIQIVGSTLVDQPFTTLSEYAAMLSNEKKRLSYLRDPDDPELDVRASFMLSLKYLDEDQISLFACLGACAPEGFSLQTAQLVSGQNEGAVRSGMGRLLRLSLINQGAEPDRFVLHPLLFLFSRELGQERNFLALAEQRHTDYFSHYADEYRGLSLTKLDALEKELDALLLTAKRLTNDLIASNAFYLSIEPFLQARGYWSQALELLDLILDVARSDGDFYRVTHCLLQRGQFFQLLARFDDAEKVLQEGGNIALQVEDSWQRQHLQAMVLNSLGGVYQRQGKFDEAVEAFQQSAIIEQEIGNQRGQAMVLNSLGGVYQRQGKFDKAIEMFQQSYDLLVKLSDKIGQAMVLFSFGKALLDHCEAPQATEKLKASFEINETLKNAQGMRIVSPSLTRALTTVGQIEEARQYISQALTIVPDDKRLLRLQEQLSEKRPVSLQIALKTGCIKRLIRNLAGYLYGFITPDDESEEIYFGENQVDAALLPALVEGQQVTVEVEMTARGPRARRVRQNTND